MSALLARRTIRALRSSRDRRQASTAVYSWGLGTQGQLGHAKFEATQASVLSTQNDYVQLDPRRLVKSKAFCKVCCGAENSMALTEKGELFAWGNLETMGSFSEKTASKVKQPTAISLDSTFTEITAGKNHYAAIDANGLVHTWGVGSSGSNWFTKTGGQLGHGEEGLDTLQAPTLVAAFEEYGAKAVSVSCGEKHTLILTEDGEVLSFGVGEYGRLGTGSTSDATTPVSIEALLEEDIVQIAVGASHSLALTRSGSIYTWGRNDMGQLGLGDSYMDIYSMEDMPRLVDSESLEGKRLVSIAAGKGRSAAITDQGELFLWGNKLHHEPMLVELPGGVKVKKVACGGSSGRHCVAIITEDDELWAMGEGKSHMLGMKEFSIKNPTFEPVPALQGKVVLDVKMGFGNHILAIVQEE